MYRIGFQASAAIFAKFFLHSPPTLLCLVSLDSLSWRTSKKLMRRRLRTLTKHSEELDRVSLSGNGTKITIYDLIFAKVVIIQPGIQTLHSFAFKQALPGGQVQIPLLSIGACSTAIEKLKRPST